jgi:hypothetical protein
MRGVGAVIMSALRSTSRTSIQPPAAIDAASALRQVRRAVPPHTG